MSNLIFEISNTDENFQIGIFENFDDKENLLKLYESLVVSTEKEFDRAIALNFTSSDQKTEDSKYYIASNEDLVSIKLNKDDTNFVERIQKLILENDFEKEHLSFPTFSTSKTSKPKEINQPSQLDILLGFATQTVNIVSAPIKTTSNSKPGRGQKSCKFCNEVIGVRCLICKFCNSSLT